MKKFTIYISVFLALVIGTFSIAKYFDMSACCQPNCILSSKSISKNSTNNCSTANETSILHHLEMVGNLLTASFTNNFNKLIFSIIGLGLTLLTSNLKLLISAEAVKMKLLQKKQKLKHRIAPYYLSQILLISKGILGSRKTIA